MLNCMFYRSYCLFHSLLCGFLSLPFLLFWKGHCCRYGCWRWGVPTAVPCRVPFSKKRRKSLGSYPGHWLFEGGLPPCLAPVTLANAFSSSSLLAAFSRKPPPNKVVSFFSLSVSSTSGCTVVGLIHNQATFYLSCVIRMGGITQKHHHSLNE